MEHVPHFAPKYWDDVEGWNRALDRWLMENFNLRQFHLAYECALDQILGYLEALNPDSIFLLAGTSRNGVAHTVVAGHRKIIWDPSRDNSGIVAPIDGHYWVTLLVPHHHYAPCHDEQAPIRESAFTSILTRPVPGGDLEPWKGPRATGE